MHRFAVSLECIVLVSSECLINSDTIVFFCSCILSSLNSRQVWREGAPAGVIVCGFHLAEDVQRGDASLPKGRIYLSLPVWTRDGLTDKQVYKAEKIAEAEQHKIDQDGDIAKMQATTNPLMKALHYRNALAASEKIMMSGVKGLVQSVPDNEDVMPIGGDLVMCTKGTVWTKNGNFLGEEHVLLGKFQSWRKCHIYLCRLPHLLTFLMNYDHKCYILLA